MKQEIKHLLIIAGVVLLLFSGIIIHGKNSIIWSPHSDLIGLYSAKAEFMHKSGLLSLLDPSNSGYPFIGNPQSMAFYIPLYPLYLSGNLFFYNIIIFFQISLAGIFMYLLAKDFDTSCEAALLAAITYMFSGIFLSYVESGHISHIVNFTFFPLIFLLIRKIFERGKVIYSIFLGYVIALSYVGGHPQFLFYIIILCCAYIIYKFCICFKSDQLQKFFKKIFIIGLAFIISLVLILPSLMSTFAFSKQVTHGDSENERWDFVSSFSFHPLLTIRFLFPNAFGSRGNYISYGSYEDTNPYVSLFGLFSVVLSIYLLYKKRMKHEKTFFIFSFIVSFLLMFGKYNPFYYLLFKYFPGFDLFRASSRFIVIAIFCSSILSAFIFDFLFRNNKYFSLFRKYLYAVAIFSLIFISIFVIFYLNKEEVGKVVYSLYKSKSLSWGWDLKYTIYRLSSTLLTSLSYYFLALLLFLLYYLVSLLNPNNPKMKHALIFVVFLDLILVSPLPKFKNVSDVYAHNSIEQFLLNDNETGLFRVFVLKKPIQKGEKYLPVREFIAYKNDIYLVKGRDTLVVWTYEKYIKKINSLNIENNTNKLKNLNVKYVITDRNISSPKFKLVFRVNDSFFSMNDTLMYKYNDWSNRYRLIDNGGEVILNSYSNSERILNVNTKNPDVLFISETYLPNWKAKIDDVPAKIELCEDTFMCIKIGKGYHKIELKYEDPFLKPGLIISVTTFFITFFILLLYLGWAVIN